MGIRLVLGDITEQQVDAIVNAANSELIPGGGVDGAIHEAAGPGLYNELKTHHKFLQPGEAIITSGYRLPSKHVIHTVAPRWIEGLDSQTEILADCYRNSLRLAKEHGLKSIAFPALGTGVFGIPKNIAMPTALSAISLGIQRMKLEIDVLICCFTEEDYVEYERAAHALGASVVKDGQVEVTQLLPDCPLCFHRLKRILYGYPTSEALQDTENIYIGGCIIEPNSPTLGCNNCNWQGFIGDLGLVQDELIVLVVDLAKKRLVAGALYEAGHPASSSALKPGNPEFWPYFDPMWLTAHYESCAEPSVWLASRADLLGGAFERILMRYPQMTKEVMSFAGFRQIDKLPNFKDAYSKGDLND